MSTATFPWEPPWSPVGEWGCKVRVRQPSLATEARLLFTGQNEEGKSTGYIREKLGFGCFNPEGNLLEDRVEEAKREAIKLSLLRLEHGREGPSREPPALTIGVLFNRFRENELPHRDCSEGRKETIRKALTALESYLGKGFKVEDFAPSDWSQFLRDRQRGVINYQGGRVEEEKKRRTVSPATAAGDLQVLRQVCRWATGYRDPHTGEILLARDPSQGLDLPENDDPPRPIVSDNLLKGLRREAPKLTMRQRGDGKNRDVRTYLPELIEVANGTGQRLGAIISLRWSDWFPDRSRYGVLRWRAENDKNKQTRNVPVTERVREALHSHRDRLPDILPDEAWMWPAPDSDGRLRKDVAIGWLQEAEREARGHHVKGFGFHAFRRRWATKNKHLPRKTAAHMGGWKGPHTMERVYQQVTEEDMERALFGGDDDGSEGPESAAR